MVVSIADDHCAGHDVSLSKSESSRMQSALSASTLENHDDLIV